MSNKRVENRTSFFFDIFESIIKALIAVFIIQTVFFKTCTVVGSSMFPTLSNGERLIISNFLYEPRENDIVVFHETGSLNEPIVKRIIATGGKWVKIDFADRTVYVSDNESFDSNDIVDDCHAYFDTGEYRTNNEEPLIIYVEEGYLFVMGDNRNNSLDSRSEKIGLVDERSVLGKVIFRISPVSAMGTVD